jgi:energy-coupling factor transporter ATP-binding protein EcfA2
MFVIVAGPPGSGKSTLAASLAPALGLPLIAKGEIKQAVMDVVGPANSVDQSRDLGRAAVMAMLTVAKSSPGAVLDSTFYPYTVDHLRQLRPPLIEIRCVCPREIVHARYQARSTSRAAGHFDDQRSPEELWNEHHLKALGLGPLIEVDTSTGVDVHEVAARVLQAAARPPRS